MKKDFMKEGLGEILSIYRQMGFDLLPLPSPRKKNRDAPEKKQAPRVLEALRTELGECTRCPLCHQRTRIMFGEGNPQAGLMFIGESPSAEEDGSGKPFTGKSGNLLAKLINKMGLHKSDVYVTNTVKCHPPDGRAPHPQEIAKCLPFLKGQIEAVGPKAIITLGTVPTGALLSTDKALTALRGKFHDYQGIHVMPTFHPTHLLKNIKDKHLTWNDALKVLAYLGIEVIRETED